MATRILVTCRAQHMPGPPRDRVKEMADIICQHQWQRPFDPTRDFYQSLGNYEADCNERIFILVDTGPAKSEEYTTIVYRWKGGKLIQVPHNPTVKDALSEYPFGYRPQRKLYSDEEFREAFGQEQYESLMAESIRSKRRWGETWLTDDERAYLETHPDYVQELNNQFGPPKVSGTDRMNKVEDKKLETTAAEETKKGESAEPK